MEYLFLVLFLIVYETGKYSFKKRINPLLFLVGVFMFAFFLLYASDFITHSISSKTISFYSRFDLSYDNKEKVSKYI